VISAGTVADAFRKLTLATGVRIEGQRLGSHMVGRHSIASSEAFRRDHAAAAAWLGRDVMCDPTPTHMIEGKECHLIFALAGTDTTHGHECHELVTQVAACGVFHDVGVGQDNMLPVTVAR